MQHHHEGARTGSPTALRAVGRQARPGPCQTCPSALRGASTPRHDARELDLLIWRPDLNRHLALELKYLTAAWSGEVDGEQYGLVSQGAQDIRAYDVLKHVQRVERFVNGHPGWSGMVLVLSNDSGYWSRPGHGRATNAGAFRIYEGQVISGSRAWGPDTEAGTMRDREAVIELRGDYRCGWSPYSVLPGSRGEFRLLAFSIDASRPSPQVLGAESQIPPSAADPPRTDVAAVSTVNAEVMHLRLISTDLGVSIRGYAETGGSKPYLNDIALRRKR